MRITRLSVSNFRAITALSLTNLSSTVVIAGPNGCGKSCILDAIRLLKSVYGGYRENEWHSWLSEFQLNPRKAAESFVPLLQDKSKPMEITASIALAPSEIAYLRENAAALIAEQEWNALLRRTPEKRVSLHEDRRRLEPRIQQRVSQVLPRLLHDLDAPEQLAVLRIEPSGDYAIQESELLAFVFSHYDASNIGVLDYHGAHRDYGREQFRSVTLNVETRPAARMEQHALYDWSNKYKNLKTEMASAYVKHLIASQANAAAPRDARLIEVLKELFNTFFPGKEFLGPCPTADGLLEFPVRTAGGAHHDIDELSSGEKEVVYGYLRLSSNAPRHSIVLIDEPELHLNPRLVRGLALFYQKHLATALDNQLWLVTHSDAMIRDAVGQPGFSVFHMHPPGLVDGEQAVPVNVEGDLERLVIDLVGDLAVYRPGAKIVIFEGGGDAEFDVQMTVRLFPTFQAVVNTIAGGSKRRVAELYDVLETARSKGYVPGRFYAITDLDDDNDDRPAGPTRFQWDVYHIENYLLVPKYVLQVLHELEARPHLTTETQVHEQLKECARECVGQLVAHRLRRHVQNELRANLDLRFDSRATELGTAVADAVRRTQERVERCCREGLSKERIMQIEGLARREADEWFDSDAWMSRLPGREILTRFVHALGISVPYTAYRNLIISRMHNDGYKPRGMAAVLERILTDP